MHPAEPVPVRLDSEPLSEMSSQGSLVGTKGSPGGTEGKADAPKANPQAFTFANHHVIAHNLKC